MKNFVYNLIKWGVKAGLHLYYGKIRISGLEHVPKNKAILFLPNHQSALLDVLLIAVDCNRKPYFLTRSDVFKGGFLKKLFNFFQMIPIYRIRDGRESLQNNQAVFNTCADLLAQKNAILLFPEANHNFKRRVRPLSKGFTRILFNTLERAPETDIQIIPVGINYRNSLAFPDKVALFFGKPIAVKESYDPADIRFSVEAVKAKVSDSLQDLTTHIADEENYENILEQLKLVGADYLNPFAANKAIASLPENVEVKVTGIEGGEGLGLCRFFFKGVFTVLNLPVLLIWKIFVKPKVWEPEFMGTLRFGFSLLGYPIYFILVFVAVTWFFNPVMGSLAVVALFLFNWLYVRTG